VPVSSWKKTRSATPLNPCCTFREVVWRCAFATASSCGKTWMTDVPIRAGPDSARNDGIRSVPVSASGPAPRWDPKRNLLYIGTGDNYSAPATDTSDAGDCSRSGHRAYRGVPATSLPGCFQWKCASSPDGCGPDFEFWLFADSDPRAEWPRMLLAGRSRELSGRSTRQTRARWCGRRAWAKVAPRRRAMGHGSDGLHVFATVSDVRRMRQSDPTDPRRNQVIPTVGGGLTALRVSMEARIGMLRRRHVRKARPRAAALRNRARGDGNSRRGITTSTDGHLRAHSAEDGELLWDFQHHARFRNGERPQKPTAARSTARSRGRQWHGVHHFRLSTQRRCPRKRAAGIRAGVAQALLPVQFW